MNAIKYIFGLPCENPNEFDSGRAEIVNDFQKKKEYFTADNLNSHRILFDEKAIKCAKEFFHFDTYELLKRMTDEKVLKTLMFLYDNEAENQCAIKIEKLPLLERFTINGRFKSEVYHGYLCLLILKNLQNSDKKDMEKQILSLINGQTVNFKNETNFSLMINYEVIPVGNADDVVAELKKIHKTIPISVRFDWMNPYKYEPIVLKTNGDSVLKLYFLVNLLLFRYYKKTTDFPDCANSMETKQLLERISLFTKEFLEQGPFHKMQTQFEEFMLLLIHLLGTIEAYAANNSTLYQVWKKYNFDECAKMLDNLARKNVIPQSDDYVQKFFKNINGDMQNILFLKYSSPNKWSKIMIIPEEKWIPIFRQFYGQDKVTEISLKNNKTIESFVWIYSEIENGTEPFIILDGERYSIGVVEREKTIDCIHVSDLTKKQWICLKCKEIGNPKNEFFNCNCSSKKKQKLSFCCLQCWSQKISNVNYETNSPTNLLSSVSNNVCNVFCKSTDNPNMETNDSFITATNSQSKIFKPEINNQLIQQQPGPSSMVLQSSLINQNNSNNKLITILLEKNLSKQVILDKYHYKLLEEEFRNAKNEPISFLDLKLCNERNQLQKDKEALEKKIKILEKQVELSKNVNQNPQPSIQQMINNENTDEMKKKLTKHKIYTIVVVGATGVGKSTLIGGIANYLKWPKFNDAVKNFDKIETCIPIKFTVLRKDNSKETCQSGFKDDELTKNENFNNDGHSVTQEPQIYEFQFNENTIRIIDTPGLEDTRGNEQDKKNMELIQKVIEKQDEIHGICIVVKANQSKLIPEFEMTIQKLLSLFPKTALNNVFFFFTFSTGTYFAIGDVLNPLKILQTKFQNRHDTTFSLESNRTYCVDSESFKHLLCKQNKIKYSTRPEETFNVAWEKSSANMAEFFECLQNIKPTSKQQIKANSNVLKLLEALKQKKIPSDKGEAFNKNFEKLKYMVLKNTLTINKFEVNNFETAKKSENVSQEEFERAINNLIELFPKRKDVFSIFKKQFNSLVNLENENNKCNNQQSHIYDSEELQHYKE